VRIAVTGASGFVGSRVVHALTRRGHLVHTFGRRSPASIGDVLPNYRTWDLRSPLTDAPAVDAIVHCGALVGDWGAEAQYRAVNVGGTQSVIDAFPAARIIYVSTSSVYSDRQPTERIGEDAPAGDCKYSAYARSKFAAEQLVLRRGASVVLRPHIVYGPGDTTLLPRLLAVRRLGTLIVPGNGHNILSVTHVDNLVDAVLAATIRHTHADGVFNIADDVTATLRELLEVFFERLQLSTRVAFVPWRLAMGAATALERTWPGQQPPRGPMLTRYLVHQLTMDHVLDIERARELLQYRPRWDFRTGPL
jgi:2-alkyl-3-oxoalkanoate reductase